LARVLFDESVLIKRGINRVRAADADCGLMNIVNKVERCLTVAQLFKQRSARVQRGGGGGGGGKGNLSYDVKRRLIVGNLIEGVG